MAVEHTIGRAGPASHEQTTLQDALLIVVVTSCPGVAEIRDSPILVNDGAPSPPMAPEVVLVDVEPAGLIPFHPEELMYHSIDESQYSVNVNDHATSP